MSVKSEVAVRCEDERGREGLSRRQFFTGAGLLTGGAFAGSILAGCSPTKNAPMADSGTPKAIGHVTHMSEICSGCRTCEIACSLTHEGVINPERARNSVSKDIYKGHIVDVLYCQQCDDPKCLLACPTGALHVDESTGARVIDQETCVGCQTCLKACVFSSRTSDVYQSSRIKYNPDTNTCFKCDLCGGDPQCVVHCPIGASMLSWKTYTINKPGDDYDPGAEVAADPNALDIPINRDFSGPYGGRGILRDDWLLAKTDEGVEVKGSWDAAEGGSLKVAFHCEFFDSDGNPLGSSEERVYRQTLHHVMDISAPFAIDDPSKIGSVTLVAYVDYWLEGTDEEK